MAIDTYFSDYIKTPVTDFLKSNNCRVVCSYACVATLVATATLEISGVYNAFYSPRGLREENLIAQGFVYAVSIGGIFALGVDSRATQFLENVNAMDALKATKMLVENGIRKYV